MDRTIAFASDGADFMWSDNQSLSSDEERTELITPPSPSTHQQSAWLSATSVVHFPTGQISPASSAMDTNPLEPTAPPMAHSTSSCTDSWSSGGAEREDVETESQWEQGSDDVLAVAKLEPMEDEFNLNDLQTVPPVEPTPEPAPKPKRPRGRPRKHPLTSVLPANKVTKGRSKTGCITCRKRKKKCDEAKPRCMNCEKNAVVCEGYHEKQVWRSGRERAQDGKTICCDV
jgi:hypothetical protein